MIWGAKLSKVFPISFTRNELLDIRNSTPDNLLPTFEHSDVLLDILVRGSAFLYKRSRVQVTQARAAHWCVREMYVSDMYVPTRTYLTFNNDKPWFSTTLKQLRQAKEDATGVGTKPCKKRPNTHRIGNGKEKLLWKAEKTAFKQRLYISEERPKSNHQLQDPTPSTGTNQQLAEDLNKFYCRFEKQKPGLTPHTHSDHLTTQPSTPSPSPLLFLSLY